MKQLVRLLILVTITSLSAKVNAQKKTILIPPAPKLKNGENLISKMDGISFYVSKSSGKVDKLYARDSNNDSPLTLIFNSLFRKKNNVGGLERTCEVCVGVRNNEGVWQYKCYEIDCNDTETLKPGIKPRWLTFTYPSKNPVKGALSVYKDEQVEIKAVYENGQIIDYTTSSLTDIKYEVEFEKANASSLNYKTICKRRVKTRLPDGTIIISEDVIDCKNLPNPKNPPTTN